MFKYEYDKASDNNIKPRKFLNRAPPGERAFKHQIRQNINYVKNLSNLRVRLRTNSVNPEKSERYTINELRSLKLLSL